MGAAIEAARPDGVPVFPAIEETERPTGIPNRVVLRVPRDRAGEIAEAMGAAVRSRWTALAEDAVAFLRDYEIEPADTIWPLAPGPSHPRQTDRVFDIAWSWVPEEEGGYAEAAAAGARRYAASRLFRPFDQVEQVGEKCALCGFRTALPNGHRSKVAAAWKAAEEKAEKRAEQGKSRGDERFLRYDQGRLCLVCATKRLYTREGDRKVYFQALDRFDRAERGEEMEKGARPKRSTADEDRRRYVAVVAMDGDKMSEILALGPEKITGGRVEEFHRAVSKVLGDFARDLRRQQVREPLQKAQLDLEFLGIDSKAPEKHEPQLIYAGGDDVLVVCAPADALPVARAVRERFLERVQTLRDHLDNPADLDRLTISGAIVYAHAKHPAGSLFREAQDLLKRKAKGEAGRDALALRLMKRSGVPVEVAFKWSESSEGLPAESWLATVDALVERLREGTLSSKQTFNLRREEDVLMEVFESNLELWTPWLSDRLSRGEASNEEAEELARHIAPFFAHGKPEALRIVRFLGVEVTA